MNKVKIYVLKDPRNDQIRYVGKTNKSLNERRTEHCNINKESSGRKANWIKQLLALKLKPIIQLIDEVNENEWTFWEKYWIETLRMLEFDLTNLTNGGEGTQGHKPSKEIIEKRIKNRRKKVKVFDINGTKIHTFDSIKDASINLNVENTSICDCMNGNRPRISKGKYVFRHIDDPFDKYSIKNKSTKSIIQCNKKGTPIKKWNSITEAANSFGIKAPNISRALRGERKTCKGFIWKYYN